MLVCLRSPFLLLLIAFLVFFSFNHKVDVKNAEFLKRLHSEVVSESCQCVRVGEPLTQAVLLVPHGEGKGASDGEVGGKLFFVITQVGQ